jgi:hypothetical protein
MGMGRAMRAMMAFQQIKALYETAAAELPGGGAGMPYDELVSHPAMLEIHNKGAQKALEVCRANRGACSSSRAGMGLLHALSHSELRRERDGSCLLCCFWRRCLCRRWRWWVPCHRPMKCAAQRTTE